MPTPCATCHARCCREHIIPLNGYDVWRIARGLEYPPEMFVGVLTQATPDSYGFLLDQTDQTFALALTKTINPADGGEQCVFWLALDDAATGRCGIYGLRPGVCRTYPAVMRGLDVVRREDVMCPTYGWRDGSLARPQWRHDILQITVEFDIYRIAVARWNRHVKAAQPGDDFTFGQYLDYLLAFYDSMAGVRDSLGEQEWTRMCDWWGTTRIDGVGPLVDTTIDAGEWAGVIEQLREIAAIA